MAFQYDLQYITAVPTALAITNENYTCTHACKGYSCRSCMYTGAFTPWWHVQFCWLPIVNSRTLPYLRPVLDSSQWDGSSGVVYQCNWKKLRAISVTYFPNQSILCYILLCPPTPVMLCSWYTTDMDCPHQALSVSDKNNKFDQLLALGMPFLKRT